MTERQANIQRREKKAKTRKIHGEFGGNEWVQSVISITSSKSDDFREILSANGLVFVPAPEEG